MLFHHGSVTLVDTGSVVIGCARGAPGSLLDSLVVVDSWPRALSCGDVLRTVFAGPWLLVELACGETQEEHWWILGLRRSDVDVDGFRVQLLNCDAPSANTAGNLLISVAFQVLTTWCMSDWRTYIHSMTSSTVRHTTTHTQHHTQPRRVCVCFFHKGVCVFFFFF